MSAAIPFANAGPARTGAERVTAAGATAQTPQTPQTPQITAEQPAAAPGTGAVPRQRAGTAPRAASRHALLSGGGTGGHVFPALAVAEELAARGWQVSFAGLAGGLEARLAPERGIPFHVLPARPVLGRGVAAKVLALGTLARSAVAAARLVRRLGATVVLGTGGYASAPAVVGGRLARRPVLLLEPNARPGLANRWLSRCATAAAVGYGETARYLHCPAVVTGVPVRRAFFGVAELAPPASPAAASAGAASEAGTYGAAAAAVTTGAAATARAAGAAAAAGSGNEAASLHASLLVLGGSQGARQINQALPAAAARLLAALPGLRIVHQAGPRNVEETRAAYAAAGVPAERAQVVPFLDDVAAAMAGSHLLVSRAGAITVAEICAAGRPALLVPLAIAEGHQVENARLLAEAGGGELLAGADLAPAALAARLLALLGDPARLSAMGRAARALARPDAAAAIAAQLAALAAGSGGAGAAWAAGAPGKDGAPGEAGEDGAPGTAGKAAADGAPDETGGAGSGGRA